MKTFSRSFALNVFKRFLDLGIGVYIILIPIVIVTGGFKVELLGLSIKANHLYTPLKVLIPLILIRLIISIELKSFLLLIFSMLMTILGIEIAMRIWDPPLANPGMIQIHRASPVFDWELVPGSSGFGSLGEFYGINSAGFRDTEHLLKKGSNIHRIMVIGDSFTFGMRVNLGDTYPKQMERMLNTAKIKSEVINCGVIGYDMWQHCEMLKRKVIPYQPDLVVLGLFFDDVISSGPGNEKLKGYKGRNPFVKRHRGLGRILSRSSVWYFLKNKNTMLEYKYRYRRGYNYLKNIEDRKKKWGPANPDNKNYKVMSGNVKKEKYLEFSNLLKQFVSTANKAGAGVLVTMIPDSVQLKEPHMQFVNRFVEKACAELAVPFIDMTPVLEAEDDLGSLYLFPIDAHNSPKGLKLIAKSISDYIFETGLFTNAIHKKTS